MADLPNEEIPKVGKFTVSGVLNCRKEKDVQCPVRRKLLLSYPATPTASRKPYPQWAGD